MKLLIAMAALCCAPAFAQFDRPVRYFAFDPPGGVGGGCKTSDNFWNNWTNGNVFKCVGPSTSGGAPGNWILFSQGGGGALPVDIRSYGAACNGTNQNTAVQAAITAGALRIFIPTGCVWIPPGGIIPGGANGLTFIGENSTTSVIKSNASPAGTVLQAASGVVIQQMNLQGSTCTNIPNCQNEFYANTRNANDIIFTTGKSALNFAAGQGGTDFSGSNFRNYGVGEAIFTDTFAAGPGLRSYNDGGSTGAAILCGNNGGSGPCLGFINPGLSSSAAHIVGYSDAGSTETSRLNSQGALTLSGYVGLRNVPITVSNGANQNIAISGAGFARVGGPTGAFSIGGIVNTGAIDGRSLTFFNGTAQIMTIKNQDAGSTAANRIFVPGGSDYVCPTTFCIVEFIYDAGTSQWILQLGGSGGVGGGASKQDLGNISTTLPIDGINGIVRTITATLTGNVTCSPPVNLTTGQRITLELTQDATGNRTFTCGSITFLGTTSGQATKVDVQSFTATASNALIGDQGGMSCPNCAPAGPVIPASSGGGSALLTAGPGPANVAYTFPNFNLDLTATGGASQFLKQNSLGGQITVAQPGFSDLSGAAACGQLPALTGDITSSACATTLANTAVTPSTYGDSTHVGQFTVDAKGRITGASNVAVSGGGGSPVASLLWPFGQIYNTFSFITTALGSTNKTIFLEYMIPSPGIILTSLTGWLNNNAAGHMAWAIYDSTCTLVANGTSQTLTTTQNVVNTWTWSPTLSLAGGKYFLAMTGDTATAQFFAPYSIAMSDLANNGESAGNYHIFTGTVSTGTTTLVFPGTCGTRTSYGTGGGGIVYPAIALH